MLTDNWYPGWKATVDGERAPVERVDYLIRGVAVPAGAHRVEFRYEPASWRAGWIVSLLALLAIVAAAGDRLAPPTPRNRGTRADRRYVRGVSAPWMSVVVPAYNEEAGIVGLIEALRSRLDAFERPYEIIVVDNGSQDRTVEVVEAAASTASGCACCATRSTAARASRCGAGCSTPAVSCGCSATPTAARRSPRCPRCSARWSTPTWSPARASAPGAQVDRQQPLRRRLVGWPFIALTRTLLREPTRDVYCGFKLWRANAAEAVFSRQRLTGWVFDAEVLALARGLGFRVTEVGVAWADRRGSKLSITQVLVPAVRELLAARRNVRAQLHAARQRPVSTSEPRPTAPSDGPGELGAGRPRRRPTTRETR